MALPKAIGGAYKHGQLLVHMLEHDPMDQLKTQQLLEVMAGEEDASYHNVYHTLMLPSKEDGIKGLATTAIKQGLPVPLWDDDSRVGLLLNAEDEAHVKPILVNAGDSFTRVDGNNIVCSPPRSEMFAPLIEMQELHTVSTGNYEMTTDMVPRARNALAKLWEIIEDKGFEGAYRENIPGNQGMNQVDAMAGIEGIKGVIIYSKEGKSLGAMVKDPSFKQNTKQANQLKEMLIELYPKTFNKALPVFSYDPSRTRGKLTEITPTVLASLDDSKHAIDQGQRWR